MPLSKLTISRGSNPIRRLTRLLSFPISFLLLTLANTPALAQPRPAPLIVPSTSVTASIPTEPLIGGTTSINIRVENTATQYGTDRGFNLGVEVILPVGLTYAGASIGESEILNDTPNPGETTIRFLNIKNLEANEVYDFSVNVNISPTAAIGQVYGVDVEARLTDSPDFIDLFGASPPPGTNVYSDTDTATMVVQAIDLEKTVIQSTAVEQTSGSGEFEPGGGHSGGRIGADWPFIYRLEVTNNPVNQTDTIIVTEFLPPGVAYLGSETFTGCAGSPPTVGPIYDGATVFAPPSLPASPAFTPASGTLQLQYAIGNMATNATCTIDINVAVPYNFRTPADVGVEGVSINPPNGPFSGAIIPDDQTHEDYYDARGIYNGLEPTADGTIHTPQDDEVVTFVSGYVALHKELISPANGLVQETSNIEYQIGWYVSEYYEYDGDDTGDGDQLIVVWDIVPDGQSFNAMTSGPAPVVNLVGAAAVPAPYNTTHPSIPAPALGETLLIWDLGAAMGPGTSDIGGPLRFTTTVDGFYDQIGEPVVGYDTQINEAGLEGGWDDFINPARNDVSTSGDSASVNVPGPSIDKSLCDPTFTTCGPGPAVGFVDDLFYYRVTFTGLTLSDLRNILAEDFLPRGQSYEAPSTFPLQATYSNTPTADSFFLSAGPLSIPGVVEAPACGNPAPADPEVPTAYAEPVINTIGSGLEKVSWDLCRVIPNPSGNPAVWQAQFAARVGDIPAVADGVIVRNFFNVSGFNTQGDTYSLRDDVLVQYIGPDLILEKTCTTLTGTSVDCNGMAPGDQGRFTITVTNIGTDSTAAGGTLNSGFNLTLVDTFPQEIRLVGPQTGSDCGPTTTFSAGALACTETAGDAFDNTLATTAELTWATYAGPVTSGNSVSYSYDFIVNDGVTAGAAATNQASVAWNSKNVVPNPPTTDDTDGRVVTTTNDPNDPNTDEIDVVFTSSAGGKSAVPPGITSLVIGDTYRQRIVVEVPGTVVVRERQPIGSGLAYLRDRLRDPGLHYIPGTESFGIITPCAGRDPVPATPFATVTDTAEGERADFAFEDDGGGIVIDNTGQAIACSFYIEMDVQVADLDAYTGTPAWLPATTAATATDRAVFLYSNGVTNIDEVIDNMDIDVAQPVISLDKNIRQVLADDGITPRVGPPRRGDYLVYVIRLENVGTGTAYEVNVTDDLPEYLEFVAGSVFQDDGGGVPANADNGLQNGGEPALSDPTVSGTPTPGGQSLAFNYELDMLPGDVTYIAYRVQVLDTTPLGQTLVNFADADWSTIDGSDPNERIYGDDYDPGGAYDTQDGGLDDDTTTINTLALDLQKQFAPNPVSVGVQSTLTFTVDNPNSTALNNIAFTDDLPAGLQIDGALGGSCTGGAPDFSITGVVGTTLITVQGVDLPATSSCTITVPVIGMAPNNYHNVTGPPGSDETGTGTPADAYLIVADDLSMHKEIAPSPIQIGQTATLTFTILNPHSFDLVNVRFFETLPVGNLGAGQMEVADPPNASTTNCGAPTWNPLAGDIDLTFSGGTIPAGTACVVQVDVTGSASDTYVNQVDPAGVVDYFDGENATTGAAVAGAPSNPATLVITNPPPQASSGPAGLTAPTPTATPEFPDVLPSTGGKPAGSLIDSGRRMALLGGLSALVIGFSVLLVLRVRRR